MRGSLHRHSGPEQLNVSYQINQPNFRFNGLKEASTRRAGNDGGPASGLEDMFQGINIAGSGYGPVGTIFNGSPDCGNALAGDDAGR
jgi:hypothetical protein